MRRAVSEDQLADYHESLTTLDALQPEREEYLDATLREAQEDAPDVIRLLKKAVAGKIVGVGIARPVRAFGIARLCAE